MRVRCTPVYERRASPYCQSGDMDYRERLARLDVSMVVVAGKISADLN
jgi:hypothetical protein